MKREEYKCSLFHHDTEFAAAEEQYLSAVLRFKPVLLRSTLHYFCQLIDFCFPQETNCCHEVPDLPSGKICSLCFAECLIL
jgi:hypothetical protein